MCIQVRSVTLEDLLEHEQAIYSTNTPATALVEGVRDEGGGAQGKGGSKGEKTWEGKGGSNRGSDTSGGGSGSGGSGGGGGGSKGDILASRGVLLENKIDALLTEIFKMQTFLLQLRQAFQDHPLAIGRQTTNKHTNHITYFS